MAPPLPSLPPPGLAATAEDPEGAVVKLEDGMARAKRSIEAVEAVDEGEAKRSA